MKQSEVDDCLSFRASICLSSSWYEIIELRLKELLDVSEIGCVRWKTKIVLDMRGSVLLQQLSKEASSQRIPGWNMKHVKMSP